MNFEALEHWKELPTEEVLLYGVSDQVDVKEAKLRELQSWLDHNIYVEVSNDGQKYISTRWALTEKFVNGNKTTKARLVARGFEEHHLTKLRTDSPTYGKESLRIMIAIIITNGWEINSLDIRSAFLQEKEISRNLFVKPPKAKTDNLWKLLKTVYGLNNASRTWYLPVRDEFIICGACVSKYDEAIIYWHYTNTLQGVVCSHVDDFFWGGSQIFKNQVICAVLKKFQITHQERAAFTYLGLQMKQLPNAVRVQQSLYVSDISSIVIQKGRSKFDKPTDDESHQLRALAGRLNWVANQTRPDVAFGARQASIGATDGTVNDLQAANKVLQKLLSEEVVLNFKNLGNIKKARISAFSDASHANLQGGSC